MNLFQSKKENKMFTIESIPNCIVSSQQEAEINNKILSQSNITSNWKYRQYIQNNANQIMKYNTMEYIYNSGNNPYPITDNHVTNNIPYNFHSIHNTNGPSFGTNNSDLKQNYIAKEQLNARMIAPSISTNF